MKKKQLAAIGIMGVTAAALAGISAYVLSPRTPSKETETVEDDWWEIK
jgi:hypothetical protein